MSFKAKTVLNKDIRVFKQDINTMEDALGEIKRFIQEKYEIKGPFTIQYEDEEKDVITIASSEDLEEAYNQAEANGTVLKLLIVLENSEQPAYELTTELDKSLLNNNEQVQEQEEQQGGNNTSSSDDEDVEAESEEQEECNGKKLLKDLKNNENFRKEFIDCLINFLKLIKQDNKNFNYENLKQLINKYELLSNSNSIKNLLNNNCVSLLFNQFEPFVFLINMLDVENIEKWLSHIIELISQFDIDIINDNNNNPHSWFGSNIPLMFMSWLGMPFNSGFYPPPPPPPYWYGYHGPHGPHGNSCCGNNNFSTPYGPFMPPPPPSPFGFFGFPHGFNNPHGYHYPPPPPHHFGHGHGHGPHRHGHHGPHRHHGHGHRHGHHGFHHPPPPPSFQQPQGSGASCPFGYGSLFQQDFKNSFSNNKKENKCAWKKWKQENKENCKKENKCEWKKYCYARKCGMKYNKENDNNDYNVEIINDSLTLADKAYVLPQQVIIKTWRIKNNGKKDWPQGMKLKYYGKAFNPIINGVEFNVPSLKINEEGDVSCIIETPKLDNNIKNKQKAFFRLCLPNNEGIIGPIFKIRIFIIDNNNNNNNEQVIQELQEKEEEEKKIENGNEENDVNEQLKQSLKDKKSLSSSPQSSFADINLPKIDEFNIEESINLNEKDKNKIIDIEQIIKNEEQEQQQQQESKPMVQEQELEQQPLSVEVEQLPPSNKNLEDNYIYKEQLNMLLNMGFNDIEKIRSLLNNSKGDVNTVINQFFA